MNDYYILYLSWHNERQNDTASRHKTADTQPTFGNHGQPLPQPFDHISDCMKHDPNLLAFLFCVFLSLGHRSMESKVNANADQVKGRFWGFFIFNISIKL